MGCFYTTCRVKQSSYTSLTTNSPSFSFSFPNEESFLVPKNFSHEIAQLKDIIIADQRLWKNYKNILMLMNKNFQEKSQSIKWFLSMQSGDESSKYESQTSLLLNSTNPYTQRSNAHENSVSMKNVFYQHFPYMKTYHSDFKTKLIFEIDSVICTRNFFARNPSFDHPFIQIEIHSFEEPQKEDELKLNEKFPEIYKIQTNSIPKSQGQSYEWKEIISSEILNLTELDQGFFKICLYFYNKRTKKKEQVGDNYIFSFSELGNQMVFEKIINIKDFEENEIPCFLLFKCQLIFDVECLLFFWKNDIEVKSEVIKRILIKTEKEKPPDPNIKKSKSLIFQDKKIKEDLKNMLESFQIAFNKTLNMSLRNERISFKEAYKKTFASKLMDSLISQDSCLLSQSGYYDNKYYLD